MRYLEVYAEQMSVLQARASLVHINELGYAFGGMKEEIATEYIRELQYEAGVLTVAPRPSSEDALARLVAGETSKVQMITE